MLKSKLRLRTMRDFRHLSNKGKTGGSKYLAVRFLKKEDQDFSRFAFIVSTKTEKKAVMRNRAKRQSRAIVSELLPKIKPGYDIALSIKSQYLPLEYEQKKEQILYLLRQNKLLLS